MFKRTCWLLVAVLVPLVVLGGIGQVEVMARSSREETAVVAAPLDVIINEWSQGNGSNKEWVELLVVNGPVDLRGWDLGDSSAGDLTFKNDVLWQSVPSGSLIVLYNGAINERDDVLPSDDNDLIDCVVVIPHNNAQFFSGSWPAFSNSTTSDNPFLRDENDDLIHDFSIAPGSSLHPIAYENAQYNGETAVGVSISVNWSNETAVSATPGTGNGGVNSIWVNQLCQGFVAGADLIVNKTAPPEVGPDSTLVYEISLQNAGSLTATAVTLTDTLPNGVIYVADDSGYVIDKPDAHTLVWQVGQVEPGGLHQFKITTTITTTATGTLENIITVTTSITEINKSNNHDSALTIINNGSGTAVLIDAILPDGWAGSDHADEAVSLRNVGDSSVSLNGWQINNKNLPANITLLPHKVIWLAKDAAAFTTQFGFAPDGFMADWPTLVNDGDEIALSNNQ